MHLNKLRKYKAYLLTELCGKVYSIEPGKIRPILVLCDMHTQFSMEYQQLSRNFEFNEALKLKYNIYF